MYFKIEKETKLFAELQEMRKEMRRCSNAAADLAKELTNDLKAGHRVGGGSFIAGGITTVETSKPMGKGWLKAKQYGKNEYWPDLRTKIGKQINDKMKALPVVYFTDLLDKINYDQFNAIPDMYSNPGFHFTDEALLVKVSDDATNYKPHGDMLEILSSEYNQIKDSH